MGLREGKGLVLGMVEKGQESLQSLCLQPCQSMNLPPGLSPWYGPRGIASNLSKPLLPKPSHKEGGAQ